MPLVPYNATGDGAGAGAGPGASAGASAGVEEKSFYDVDQFLVTSSMVWLMSQQLFSMRNNMDLCEACSRECWQTHLHLGERI